MRRLALWILTLGSLTYCFGGAGQSERHVWLVGNNSIVEYDASTWSVVNRIPPPESAPEPYGDLQIVPSGAMLSTPDCGPGAGFPQNSGAVTAWIWDGERSSALPSECRREVASAVECRESVRESCPRMALSRDGRNLYWFANEFETVRQVDGPDLSVSATFHAWQTDLAGTGKIPIADFSFPPCVCETGACPETCPEADVWFPAAGVDDFFIVRHFIEGQIGSTSMDSFIYRNKGGKWSSSKFPRVFDAVLDAGAGGDTVVYAVRDSGCCGWDNDSDDQTVLSSDGVVRVIFDEREKFANPNYDVSFYTSKALLSPDMSHIAVNIAASQRQNDEIRLSGSGQENPVELARIREALKTMPSVEVIPVSGPKSPLLSFPNASLVGWLGENDILVTREGMLVRCDITANVCRNTPVSLQKGAAVFIR